MNHQVLIEVTERIRERSAPLRAAYLKRVDAAAQRPRGTDRMGCSNVAHAVAALPANDKLRVVVERAPNIGIVTAYNDMLSAHQPYEVFPQVIRDEARRRGANAQVAGGVPAMCDGITQGEAGMELSLFSREVIALATAVALSHNTFDAALCLIMLFPVNLSVLFTDFGFKDLYLLFYERCVFINNCRMLVNDCRVCVYYLRCFINDPFFF